MSLAFIFPGQGSQTIGMGKYLYENFDSAKKVFEEASDSISLDLKKLMFDGTESDLTLTANAQPAIVTCSAAALKVFKSIAPAQPVACAGHSVGEYSALISNETLTLAAAVKSVRARGAYMQEAVPAGLGGMAAVMGLDDIDVEVLCNYATEKSKLGKVSAANFNCPGQVVISGSLKTIQWMNENIKVEDIFQGSPKKIRIIPLQVSAPFHCEMMKPAEDKMSNFLSEINFSNPAFSIYQNIDAKPQIDAKIIKANLISQICGAVRWTQTVKNINEDGIKTYVELGQGKVLAGLIKKISPDSTVYNLQNQDDVKKIEEGFKV
jgi:[acyl-carrier-protein] S-malonyltransferase